MSTVNGECQQKHSHNNKNIRIFKYPYFWFLPENVDIHRALMVNVEHFLNLYFLLRNSVAIHFSPLFLGGMTKNVKHTVHF